MWWRVEGRELKSTGQGEREIKRETIRIRLSKIEVEIKHSLTNLINLFLEHAIKALIPILRTLLHAFILINKKNKAS